VDAGLQQKKEEGKKIEIYERVCVRAHMSLSARARACVCVCVEDGGKKENCLFAWCVVFLMLVAISTALIFGSLAAAGPIVVRDEASFQNAQSLLALSATRALVAGACVFFAKHGICFSHCAR
jgi:hypothetical protein